MLHIFPHRKDSQAIVKSISVGCCSQCLHYKHTHAPVETIPNVDEKITKLELCCYLLNTQFKKKNFFNMSDISNSSMFYSHVGEMGLAC